MKIKSGANAPAGSARLEKARSMLLALQPLGADLVLMTAIEVLLWTV